MIFPGPDVAPPLPDVYLRPILRQAAQRVATQLPNELVDDLFVAIERITSGIASALTTALPKYLQSAESVEIFQYDPLPGPEGMSEEARIRLVEHLLGRIDVQVSRSNQPDRWEASGALGAGARRGLALASLELFRNIDLWPADRAVIIAVEEPEVGLHPGAQRAVARSLKDLPSYGVQTIVVTHSPAVLNASARTGVRIAVRAVGPDGGPTHKVLEPLGLQEVLDVVGASPADLLLGERFIVVEGESDVEAMRTWATKLGLDLEATGVRFFAAGTYSMAAVVAKLLPRCIRHNFGADRLRRRTRYRAGGKQDPPDIR